MVVGVDLEEAEALAEQSGTEEEAVEGEREEDDGSASRREVLELLSRPARPWRGASRRDGRVEEEPKTHRTLVEMTRKIERLTREPEA